MKTRRDFIKISALGLGAVTLAGSNLKWVLGSDNGAPGSEPASNIPLLSRYPTYCEVCFWKCAGWVYLDNEGKIQKVVGNEEDPLCNGRLCPGEPGASACTMIRTG